MAEPVAGPVTFTYNAAGQRVEKESPSETTRFVYDGNKLLQETDGTGDVEQQYLSTLAEWGELISGYDGLETSTYHYDAIGSADALLDESETATDRYEHRAFGLQQSHTGSSDNPFTFVGRQGYYRDEELALYLAGARYYDPAAGRWLSEDPIRLAGGDPNLYRYVKNNPVNATDPSGLKDGSGWKGADDLLDTLSIPITFGTTRNFVTGVAEGFVVEGLWETAKGVKALVVGIGQYLYFAGSYWKGGLDSAAQTSAGQSIDAATTATLKYGPTVAAIAGDLPILAGTRSGELSPETTKALQTASEVLPEIISAITEEMATMPDERKAKLAGTLLGIVLFEVALAAATAGAAVALSGAAKAGKLAGITRKLNKIASPALVRKLEKILDWSWTSCTIPRGSKPSQPRARAPKHRLRQRLTRLLRHLNRPDRPREQLRQLGRLM